MYTYVYAAAHVLYRALLICFCLIYQKFMLLLSTSSACDTSSPWIVLCTDLSTQSSARLELHIKAPVNQRCARFVVRFRTRAAVLVDVGGSVLLLLHMWRHTVALIVDVAHPWLLSRNETEAAYLEGEWRCCTRHQSCSRCLCVNHET